MPPIYQPRPFFHARTKHIEIHFHFLRKKVARKQLQILFISFQAKGELADILTKALSVKRFEQLREKLSVQDGQLPLRGRIKEKAA